MNQKSLPTEKQLVDIPVSLKGIDEEKRTIFGATASDGLLDRHGESLNPSGWKINGSVPILWGHDYSALPVGKTLQTYVEDGKLKFDAYLSQKYDFAKTIFDLITEGIIEKVSVGFIPLKWDESGDFTYAEMELLEISFVSVPANPRAGIKQKSIDEIAKVETALKKLIAVAQKDEGEPSVATPGEEEVKGEEETGDELPVNDEKAENEQLSDEELPEVAEEAEKSISLSESELKDLLKETITEYIKQQEVLVNDKQAEEQASTKEALIAMRELLKSSDKSTEQALKKLKELVE